jgi:predicted aconitase with swiveling domain
MVIPARTLHPGRASGEPVRLTSPLSFWGGTDERGRIVDAHHPQCGMILTGRVLVMESGRGSSSASSVFAEQIRAHTAPVAIILARPDTILALGALVAHELYGLATPVIVVDRPAYDDLPTDRPLHIEANPLDATITW